MVRQQEKPVGMTAKELFQHSVEHSDMLSQWLSGAEAMNAIQVEADCGQTAPGFVRGL